MASVAMGAKRARGAELRLSESVFEMMLRGIEDIRERNRKKSDARLLEDRRQSQPMVGD
jgi:hypothetical protein